MKRITTVVVSTVLLLTIIVSLAVPMQASALDKISSFKQTYATSTSVSLKWSIVPGANLYQVQISTNNLKYFPIYLTDIPQGKITDLKSGSSYYFRIRAIRTSTGEDDDSYSKTIKAVTVPESVTGIKQTNATTNSITIRWNAGRGATQYKVCKRVNGKEISVGTTTKTEYTIKGFSNLSECKTPVYVKSLRKGTTYTAEESYGLFTMIKKLNQSVILGEKIVLTPRKQSVGNVYSAQNSSVKAITPNVPFSSGSEVFLTKQNYVYRTKEKTSAGYTFLMKMPTNVFFEMKNRAYSEVNNQKKYGAWSDSKYFALGKAPTLTGGKKSIKVKWDAFDGATDYTVYATTNPLFEYRKIVTTKKTTYRITNLEGMKLTEKTKYYSFLQTI